MERERIDVLKLKNDGYMLNTAFRVFKEVHGRNGKEYEWMLGTNNYDVAADFVEAVGRRLRLTAYIITDAHLNVLARYPATEVFW